jgi:ABC-type transporter Mla subunit MlaD
MAARPRRHDEEVERMSEQAGPSLGAIRTRQSVLESQHSTTAEADRVLAEALTSAHAATRESIRRLDAIAEEIDRAATDRADLAVDTPMGVREFQRFLVAKQREIATVVADAHELDRAKRTVLDGLRARYAVPAG